MKTFEKKGLTKKSDNISEWYHDVVLRASMADYSDVKGCMIIKPYGYAIWEKVQATLDSWFKEYGIQNVYFPIFIPMSLLQKEKEHVAGFSPELAVVTHAGGEELAEPLAVRPTSETIMYKTYAEWIQSYRDLPLLLNQWANVVRWEKRTYPFLRTTEFLWQEGHTAHVDDADALKMTLTALNWYKKFYEEYFAISPYVGMKSESEKFAGAKTTYSVEIVLPDGKALQAATSHNLGDNFAKVFEVQYLDEKGDKKYAHQTSWGLSTRALGGLILVHGDDSGLVMPPETAPIQAVILAIQGKEKNEKVTEYAEKIGKTLKKEGIRVSIDTDTNHTLGYRINEWELKGVPVRIEIGGKEADAESATIVRRDNFEKNSIKSEEILEKTKKILDAVQESLYKRSEKMKHDMTAEAADYKEFKKIMEDKKMFIRAFWCEDKECEAKIKEETKASTRVLEMDRIDKKEDGRCIYCGKSAYRKWLFAQSY